MSAIKIHRRYVAYTIHFKDVIAAAKKKGWTEGESPNDYVEAEMFSKSRLCENLNDAVEFVTDFVKKGKSYYGGESVYREELIRDVDGFPNWRNTDRWTVTDEGIEDHEVMEKENE